MNRLPPGDGPEPNPTGKAHHPLPPPITVNRVDMSGALLRVRYQGPLRPAPRCKLSVAIQSYHEVHKRPAVATQGNASSGQPRPHCPGKTNLLLKGKTKRTGTTLLALHSRWQEHHTHVHRPLICIRRRQRNGAPRPIRRLVGGPRTGVRSAQHGTSSS